MKDSELKDYFHRNRPHASDEATFLAGLSVRMDAVTEIKRMHDASIRKYRRICVATFAVGCAMGIAVVLLITFRPETVSSLKAGILPALSSITFEWKTVMALAVAVVSLVLGLIPWKKGFDVSPIRWRSY